MNRLILSASALLLTGLVAHAEEPVLTSGTYIFAGGTSLLSESTRKSTSESGLVIGLGMASRGSQRQVGVPSWELTHFLSEGQGNTLTATGISYVERAPTTSGARSYYGFGLGVASLKLTVPGPAASPITEAQRTTRATNADGPLANQNLSGTRVMPSFLLGTPLGSKAFIEARYTGLGSLSGVRADQYSLSLGIHL
jgi:hypothetical protein